jgi:uncharacterized protein (UPF0264 family)
MARLMVSARTVVDALVAVESGADLVDLKEPRNGALGMAPGDVVAAAVRAMPPSVPLALSLGEWRDWSGRGVAVPRPPRPGAYFKVGLAGLGSARGDLWRADYRRWRARVAAAAGPAAAPRWVAVLYADWQAAASPPPGEVVDLAREGFAVLLVDTFEKRAPRSPLGGLFDALDGAAIGAVVRDAQGLGLEAALSGSLTDAGVARAAALGADVVGVRAAACHGRRRDGALDGRAVRRLVALAHGADHPWTVEPSSATSA